MGKSNPTMIVTVYKIHKSGRVCAKPCHEEQVTPERIKKECPKSRLDHNSKKGFYHRPLRSWQDRWLYWFWRYTCEDRHGQTPLFKYLTGRERYERRITNQPDSNQWPEPVYALMKRDPRFYVMGVEER